jgi:acetyl-CoA carboxylase carboxyl transferase subunit beta
MSNWIKEEYKKRKSRTFKYFKARQKTIAMDADVPTGLYTKCPSCKTTIQIQSFVDNDFVCTVCHHPLRMRAIDRLNLIVDRNSFVEKGLGFITLNPLFQDGYEEKIASYKKKTGLDEAYVYGYGEIFGAPCVVGVMDSFFMMGSMGSVVGEKVTKSFEYAMYKKLPIILFTASGGARMQEGIFSLMQMAKTSAAVKEHSDMGLLYISVLTHPTTGGVTASFAMLGDIIIAEPDALIGFAGPRVIEQTIKQSLPEGFQRSEFLLEKGFLDKVVDRHELKKTLARILHFHQEGL